MLSPPMKRKLPYGGMKMKKGDILPIEILQQGIPEINSIRVLVLHDDVFILELDMKTKRCEFLTTGSTADSKYYEFEIMPTNGTPGITKREDDFHYEDATRIRIDISPLNTDAMMLISADIKRYSGFIIYYIFPKRD